MQLHTLKRKTKKLTSKQVGRGGTRGKTSGRGTKGQKARAGRKIRPELRDMIKRIPKLRGRGKNSNKSIQVNAVAIPIAVIVASFDNGDKITLKTLMEKGIVEKYKGNYPKIKVLGKADITKKLNFVGCIMSASVKNSVEKAGGTVVLK